MPINNSPPPTHKSSIGHFNTWRDTYFTPSSVAPYHTTTPHSEHAPDRLPYFFPPFTKSGSYESTYSFRTC